MQQQEVDAFLKSLTSSTVQLTSTPHLPEGSTQGVLLASLTWMVRGALKAAAFLVYCVGLIIVTPFLDLAMMGLELLGGSVIVQARSSVTRNLLAFQNFLLQVRPRL